MVLDLGLASLTSITLICVILGVCTVLDLRERRIPNRIIVVFAITGALLVVVTGHLAQDWILHLSSTATFLTLGYILFKMGAIGGGDLKTSLLIGLVSPGLELVGWADPVLEGFMISAIELAIMLLLGYLAGRIRDHSHARIPLIPLIFVAYLAVQIMSVF